MKGFTLIELLIVVGVVGVLAGVAMTILRPAHFRNQAQDSRRVGELTTIQTALELDFADNNQYPASLPPGVPTSDPDGNSYEYCPDTSDYLSYEVCTTLEVLDSATAECSTGSIGACAAFSDSTYSCCLTNPF